jgi:MFS family permease
MRIPREKLAPTPALLVSTSVTAMQLSIVSTTMPSIIGELGGLTLYSWAFAAYLLTSTTSMPIYGKLSDLYGRKPIFMISMGIFLLGSLLCGLATSMEQLIVFRAVQGLGAAGINPIVLTIAGDLFSLEERARIQSVLSTMWAVGAVLGPLVGSLIVSVTTWRWVFWMDLPIGLVVTAILATSFHEQVVAKRHQIDYLGAALLTGGITALLLALVEGGQSGFDTLLVLGLLAGAAVLLTLFVWVESRAPEPIVPLNLLRHRLLGLTSLGGLLVGACMYSNASYLPLFVQGGQGGSPRDVAWVTGTMSVLWTIGTVFGGQLLIRKGFRATVIAGMVITSLGALLLTQLALDTPLPVVVASGVVVSIGLGFTTIAQTVASQTAVTWEQRGVATALQQFFRASGRLGRVSESLILWPQGVSTWNAYLRVPY